MPPFSKMDRLADLGAIPGKYVSLLLNFISNAVKAVAREAICFSLLSGSSVGTNGKSLLLFFCTTRGLERLRRFIASKVHNG